MQKKLQTRHISGNTAQIYTRETSTYSPEGTQKAATLSRREKVIMRCGQLQWRVALNRRHKDTQVITHGTINAISYMAGNKNISFLFETTEMLQA